MFAGTKAKIFGDDAPVISRSIQNNDVHVSINKPKADGGDVKTDVEVPALERPVAGDSKGVNLRIKGTGKVYPTRQIDSVTEVHIIDRVKELRGKLSSKYKKSGNFALAEVDVNSLNKKEFYASSKIDEFKRDLEEKVPEILLNPNEPMVKRRNRMRKFTEIIERFEQNLVRDGQVSNEAKQAFGQASLDDLNYITRLYETFTKWSAFYKENDLENLKSYVIPETIVTFYRDYEPQNLPGLSGGIRLLGLEQIKEENASAVPSMFLVKFGLLTVATTIGGNVICLDLNAIKNDEPRVLIADHSFCSYNDDLDVVECVIVPDDIADNYSDDEPIVLNYDLIKSCLPQVADSFSDFLIKLANEEYVNIENEYL